MGTKKVPRDVSDESSTPFLPWRSFRGPGATLAHDQKGVEDSSETFPVLAASTRQPVPDPWQPDPDLSSGEAKLHHPPHFFGDDSWYMLTSTTFGRRSIFSTSASRALLQRELEARARAANLKVLAWVILPDHYHLLVKIANGQSLRQFAKDVHGVTARAMNLADSTPGRRVWHNYWDTRVRDEADRWTHLNYIHQNPIKHGLVGRLEDWPWSSYGYYLRTKGAAWLTDCFARYPIVDFMAVTEGASSRRDDK